MNIPIVTLDKVYIEPDEENIYFLDCTRINGTDKIVSRKNESLDNQLRRLKKTLEGKEIILADDVVFSGTVVKKLIEKLMKNNIKVVGVISSICTEYSYAYFNKNLKYGIESNYIIHNDVIDQVCERDFYFGIAGSGIMIETENGLYKAPYFKPFGNPNERASIPEDFEDAFSIGCIDRSIYLWEEIDKLKGIKTKIIELPEKIVRTKKDEEVVKLLKKERKII